ncbi:hypothetical protein [Frigidibacter sp. MR17.24]|uniref:hypothetical protein n=1 Tax=Frigidibacter sp. MR17.24 TaxID=3127345 RepID=UPI003012E9B5
MALPPDLEARRRQTRRSLFIAALVALILAALTTYGCAWRGAGTGAPDPELLDTPDL